MGNMKKTYWLTMNNKIQKKFPCENLCTWEQTNQGGVRCVNNIIKRRASLALAPKF
jgi:hypothetical protein